MNMPQAKKEGQQSAGSENSIAKFLKSLSEKDKLAYGLIAIGTVLLIIGIVLW